MISFYEKAGAVEIQERLSAHPLWLAAVRDAAARLAAKAPLPVKAARFPILFVTGLEDLVMDVGTPSFSRFMAWVRLVKLWAALRSDDTEGLVPRDLRLTTTGMEGLLQRTKTSGPGRKHRYLPFYVHKKAYLLHPGWLQTGFELLSNGPYAYPRDYLVPVADTDYTGPVQRMARYSDRAIYGRKVLQALHPPGLPDAAYSYLAAFPQAASFWTEHSERNFLPTIAALMGFD